ncbi:MAG TPA: type II toxin-antitoxin system RelE/ParE family toxin [Allosphingosinicella sp.]
MKRVDITPAADRDADEIFAYIAGDDPRAAEEQIQRIFTAAKRLADFPESGRARPELGPGARTIVVGRYLLLYRVGPDSVDILRIVHGARELAGLLDDDEAKEE